MPKQDTNIDTGGLGLALRFFSPGKHAGPAGLWRIEFDTGAYLLLPARLFDVTKFHLAERD